MLLENCISTDEACVVNITWLEGLMLQFWQNFYQRQNLYQKQISAFDKGSARTEISGPLIILENEWKNT